MGTLLHCLPSQSLFFRPFFLAIARSRLARGWMTDGLAFPLSLSPFSCSCSHFGLRNNNKDDLGKRTKERTAAFYCPLPSHRNRRLKTDSRAGIIWNKPDWDCPLDLLISVTGVVNFAFTNGLCPTSAGQKYATNAEIHPNLSWQSVSLLPA